MTGGQRLSGRSIRAAGAIAACSLLLLAPGCGERSEPTGPAIGLYPLTVTGAADRSLVISAPARRIAVLSRDSEAILKALGARSSIAGMPIDGAGRLQPARLARLRADLVVASSSTDEAALSRAAAITRAPVYVLPDSSIREVERAIIQLGLVTARPAVARRLVRRIESQRSRAAWLLRGQHRVSVFVDLGFFTTASDQSLIGDLIREAHGRNVAGILGEAGSFDLRTLTELDPDVYVATSDSGTTLAGLRSKPITRRLRAVRTGRFAVVDASLLEPGPQIGAGLLELARTLHPDAVP